MENKLHNEKEYYYKDQQFFQKESEKELFQKVNETYNSYAGTNDIQRQENTGENTLYRRLRDFKEGEYAHSVRSFNSSDYFDFTSKSNKIYNNEEVAFLFQELQNESVEHSFAVVVDKENNFKPLWLTSGNIVTTTVDLHAILFAANAFNAKEVYFIHNHPSGDLTPSQPDKSVMKQLKEALKPYNINTTGIIINVTSGKYAVFNEEVDVTNRINLEKSLNDYKPEIFNFSKRTFLQKPNVINKIKNNQDAAAFISSIKYSAAEKGGYILLDRNNNAIGNIFFNKESAEQNSKEALLTAIRYNATALIIYGNNNDFIYSIEEKLSPMAKDAAISILDTVVLESPTEIIKEAFVENINKDNTPEVLQNFASNKEAVNEGFEKYLKGKIIDKNDAENFISFVHSPLHIIQKNQSMADHFQNEISFSGRKENIQEFNKELIKQGVQASFNDEGTSITFKSHTNEPLHELIEDTMYEYNLESFNYKYFHEINPMATIGAYKGTMIVDDLETFSFSLDNKAQKELLNNIINNVKRDPIGQVFTFPFTKEIIYNNIEQLNKPIGNIDDFVQSEIDSLKKNESFINQLKSDAKLQHTMITDFMLDNNNPKSWSEGKEDLHKLENAFMEMEKLFPSITLQTYTDDTLRSYNRKGEEVQINPAVSEDIAEYKNKINSDTNSLSNFQSDSDFVDQMFDDIDNQEGDLWKKENINSLGERLAEEYQDTSSGFSIEDLDIDEKKYENQQSFANEKELLDSVYSLDNLTKYKILSETWANEFSDKTELSKGMTMTDIDEKYAEYYRKYNSERQKLNPEYSQDNSNTTNLTVHDLAKELDALYKQSNQETTFQFDSKEGLKIIEFIKSLETNESAMQAVLNHTDILNNFPIKPNARDYFSNEFVEANMVALEKYDKDLIEFSINYQNADKKLYESEDELWKHQIDPINIPSTNIRETLLAMDEVFQNHNISSNLKNYTMANEKQQPQTSVGEQANIKYLQDQIKYTGFKLTDRQNKELVDNIEGKKEAFSINVNNKQQEKGGVDAEINYTLNFKKSATGEMQFFNSYDAELIKKDGTKLNHNFSISNTPGAKNITALEAFNLLDGRFVNKDLVNKEGQKANYWVGIDFDADKKENNNYAFKMFHQNYGYDLKASMDKVGAEPSEQLIKGLEKGNRMPMHIVQNNKIESLFADANPQMKTFNFYDKSGNKQFIKIDNEVEKSQNNKVDNKPQEEQNTSRGRKM